MRVDSNSHVTQVSHNSPTEQKPGAMKSSETQTGSLAHNAVNQDLKNTASNINLNVSPAESTTPKDVLQNASIQVTKVGSKKDSFGNLELEVSNRRTFNLPEMDKGLFIPSQGATKEKVENVHEGRAIKGKTKHSDWNRRRAPSDKHSVNISSVAKPSQKTSSGDFVGKLIQGKTVAQQMFVFKSKSQPETTFPQSGFNIEYTSEVFDANGQRLQGDEIEVHPNSDIYAVLSIKKSPADVTIDGVTVQQGGGEAVEAKWKISRDTQSPSTELKWNIEEI
ncbi:hypothetical protein [Algicola sagamiensis]|uniref:hypothetical protein n=1 Tax=Algicola sagamiensis TaxID=163869 RepID=UPI000360AD35|nr:hypothetical protein [Algicola sagamiensis]